MRVVRSSNRYSPFQEVVVSTLATPTGMNTLFGQISLHNYHHLQYSGSHTHEVQSFWEWGMGNGESGMGK